MKKTIILKPWLEPEQPFLVSLFALGTVNTWINYFLSVISSPGTVPKSFKAKSKDGFRWCGKCSCYKPPRTHHCSQCKQCILKMDHHCPWINNCVGFYNHGHFYRFLCSVSFTSVYALILIGRRIWMINQYQQQFVTGHFYHRDSPYFYVKPPSDVEIIVMAVNCLVFFVLTILVGALWITQTMSIFNNTTTLENMTVDRLRNLEQRGKVNEDDIHPPYHIGVFKNFKQVLGKFWCCWCLPQWMSGDGTQFETNRECMWPPMEYYDDYAYESSDEEVDVPLKKD